MQESPSSNRRRRHRSRIRCFERLGAAVDHFVGRTGGNPRRESGALGLDVNPKADGPETQPYIENYELQPIDAQTNGPQLLYGLRYHTRVVKPADPETFHDQVGYWLWEPATGDLLQTLAIRRGQVAMFSGRTAADKGAGR